ncbi:hypothetical protein [Microbacterium imperiale]|uniref:Uncharacterized protein n=1 Tax=Microbacterium imperiale TaxID=33884 RepID=A0A9W6HGR8_9MICO|nr:hypothetical protein [Microbacterium imperiale]MBP2422073.1 uncharacterized protein YcbX [Microbacterium imperiale]MDS0200232.1 hypothetical protein [Microbacterium imperiale]BFE39384.1 hypothetical protein GCM10017544_03400 [Microbacterium imperiale]GLJ79749.1 hypothetical protein GCM10017586_14310 [Microbacterium imperiale]
MTATNTSGCATYSWCVETDREHTAEEEGHYGEIVTARAGASSVRVWADQRPGQGWVVLLDELEWRIQAATSADLGHRIQEELRDLRSIVDQIDDALTQWHASLPA